MAAVMRKLARLIDRLLGLFRPPPRRQVAALCWREGEAGLEFLLVTTRKTGRWTPPRGWPMAGRTLAESAAAEAWEEAGAVGVAAERQIGVYHYDKLKSGGGGGAPIEVALFALKVERREKKFREAGQRKHRWMRPEDAADAVREPGLKRMILGFEPANPVVPDVPRR